MLLRIDDSVVSYSKASTSNLEVARQAIENISIAHRKALHLVTGSPATLLWIYNNIKCGDETRSSILKLQNESIQNNYIHNAFCHYICITGDQEPEGKVSEGTDKSHTKLSIRRFANFDLCKEPIFLAENLIDIEFCHLLARAYRHAGGVLSKNMKFDERPGGGSTTAPILQLIKSQMRRLCLCVVDSDKKFPTDNYKGTTADTLRTEPRTHLLCDIHVIEIHEAENILSASHLSNIYKADPVKSASCEILLRIEASDSDFLRYHDIKNGIILKQVFTTPPNTAHGVYLRAKLPIMTQHCTTPKFTACLSRQNCLDAGSCSCTIISPLGQRVLNDFVESVKDFSDAKLHRYLDNKSSNEYSLLGRKVYEFFCSAEGFAL